MSDSTCIFCNMTPCQCVDRIARRRPKVRGRALENVELPERPKLVVQADTSLPTFTPPPPPSLSGTAAGLDFSNVPKSKALDTTESAEDAEFRASLRALRDSGLAETEDLAPHLYLISAPPSLQERMIAWRRAHEFCRSLRMMP